MGLFSSKKDDQPMSDLYINDFWKWFPDFETTLADFIRGLKSGNAPADSVKKGDELTALLNERLQRCLCTKDAVKFEFIGDADDMNARVILSLYTPDKKLRNAIKRMDEIMPPNLKKRWDVKVA